MILPFEQIPVHLLDGTTMSKRGCQSYIMYAYRWTPDEVENYKRDRTLPGPCSLAGLSPYQMVMPITMIHRRASEHTGWESYQHQRLSLRKFSAIAQDYPQMIIMTDQIDDINTPLCVIPSEHIVPTRQDFERIVKYQHRLKGMKQTSVVGGGLIYLDTAFEEAFMHYRYPLADIPALLLQFFGRGEGDTIFKQGIPAVDRASYVCRYTVMVGRQLEKLLQVADQFKVKPKDGDGNEVVVLDEGEGTDFESE